MVGYNLICMTISSTSNKRIAKNTLFLYCRQLITMGVSLYTVRVVLDVLGAEDYGIYNVIGGVVSLFSFLSGTMASATQRFLSFEMGKQDNASLTKVFSVSMYTYLLLVGIILVLSETIGLWFVNSQLTISAERLTAANFVYQSSILSFIVTLLCIPYNASIIAMERMNVFAYSSIVDAGLKLIIAWLLPYIAMDHLKVYAILMFIAIASVQLYYVWYCRRYFDFCRYNHYKDRSLFRNMLSFAGWNMIGALANILRGQGLNVLINLFFNPILNAAYGIALQVNNAITNFTNNFYTAVRPQLVKLYAGGNTKGMLDLGYQSSRFAFYLMLVITVPIMLNTEEILSIWLKEVPEYTVIFLRIIIISSLIEVLSIPLANMLQASGKIKVYQMTVSVLFLLNIPVSYMFLRLGYCPEITLWVNLSLIILSMFPRLYICKNIIGLSINEYLQNVILRISVPLVFLVPLFWLLMPVFSNTNISISILVQICLAGVLIYATGFSRKEKALIVKQLKQRIK